jgi:Flp pilus assembly protein TadD
MSRTLSLFDTGFATATALARSGRVLAARAALDTLLAGTGLAVVDQTRARREAAQLAMRAEKYKVARNHLRAAIRNCPDNAEVHHSLGRAYEDDPFGCDRRAARCYRKASQLDASSPLYKASLGRAMVRIHETRSGVRVLQRAAEIAPTDRQVLEVVADGLREAGQSELAFRILSKARFLSPADDGIRALWDRAKYDMAHESQRTRQPASNNLAGDVLPLLRIHDGGTKTATRTDRATTPVAHIGRFRAYRD